MPITTKEKIIENFNNCIEAIENAHSNAAAKDFNTALENITHSAGLVYNTIEWFIKYYVYTLFPDPVTHSIIHNTLEASAFGPKMKLFVDNANPPLSTTGIDTTIIKDLKQIIRNDPEHSGITPPL